MSNVAVKSQRTLSTLRALWALWCETGTGRRVDDTGSHSRVHARAYARDDGKESRGREERAKRGLPGAANPDDLNPIPQNPYGGSREGTKDCRSFSNSHTLTMACTPLPK